MKFTAAQIADVLDGEVIGDPNTEVNKLAKIEEADKGSLTFLANLKYVNFIYNTEASITIGNNVRIQAQSGVGKIIKDGEIIQGSPSFGYSDYSKSYVHFKNLPKIVNEIQELKKIIVTKKNNNG